MRDFIIHILHDILLGWLSQEDTIYETCSMHGSVQKFLKDFVWKIWTARGRPCVDKRKVLKLILHRGRVWTGLIYSCEYGNETLNCINSCENVLADLAAMNFSAITVLYGVSYLKFEIADNISGILGCTLICGMMLLWNLINFYFNSDNWLLLCFRRPSQGIL